MLLILPPSESKRDGGTASRLDLAALSFAELEPARSEVVDAAVALATDVDATMRALKLGPRQAAEVDRNRVLRSAPTMPAIDRYTGVLFDALDAATLDARARRFAASHLAVHSAMFGLVGALDLVPAYRLSHDSRLPGLRLKQVWRERVGEVLAARQGLIVDLRSEGYTELGPAPVRPGSVYVRVISVDDGGRRRALNHFNKNAKGRFARAYLEHRPRLRSIHGLLEWASGAGFRLELGSDRIGAPLELELVA
ncbi:peroxide stress protein YaaA [Agromyces sp. ISL-38]|uniref:YaaA family protein n=1 Tax=Agromyces sp. ISL-38 TaxID=2819107 RepID=UPI001BE78E4D|nr:peroxide stress protein YaaA [Agromyces sp. ISL-38]MBT2498289.1 peroxide stress protein YaaA [Agromyces sp. ISL-38]